VQSIQVQADVLWQHWRVGSLEWNVVRDWEVAGRGGGAGAGLLAILTLCLSASCTIMEPLQRLLPQGSVLHTQTQPLSRLMARTSKGRRLWPPLSRRRPGHR